MLQNKCQKSQTGKCSCSWYCYVGAAKYDKDLGSLIRILSDKDDKDLECSYKRRKYYITTESPKETKH